MPPSDVDSIFYHKSHQNIGRYSVGEEGRRRGMLNETKNHDDNTQFTQHQSSPLTYLIPLSRSHRNKITPSASHIPSRGSPSVLCSSRRVEAAAGTAQPKIIRNLRIAHGTRPARRSSHPDYPWPASRSAAGC